MPEPYDRAGDGPKAYSTHKKKKTIVHEECRLLQFTLMAEWLIVLIIWKLNNGFPLRNNETVEECGTCLYLFTFECACAFLVFAPWPSAQQKSSPGDYSFVN